MLRSNTFKIIFNRGKGRSWIESLQHPLTFAIYSSPGHDDKVVGRVMGGIR